MDKYNKVEISFNKEDTEESEKLYLKVYLRRESDRSWFEANVTLYKSYIIEIKGLSKYQKDKYMRKTQNKTKEPLKRKE